MKTINTKDEDLLTFYKTNHLFRKDFSNLRGYEHEWKVNRKNIAFTNKDSEYYYIKKMQTEIYLELIMPYLQSKTNLNILDFGGGIGRFIPYFINQCKQYDLVETCKSNIQHARQKHYKYSKLKFYWQTLESFRSSIKYDLILAPEIICYHKAPIKLIKQLKRLLSPTGKLFLSVENINCSKLFYNSKIENISNSKYFPYLLYKKKDYYVRPTTHQFLTRCLEKNKFSLLKSDYIFNKLEGKNYRQLDLKQLKDSNYYKQIISNELSLEEKNLHNNCRAIYAIMKSK